MDGFPGHAARLFSMNESLLEKLQQTLNREMPITIPMGLIARSWDGMQLSMSMPLEANRNHQYSAFAGSLNALCTATGWGTVLMLLESKGMTGNIVIRRSQIRYHRPVRTPLFIATSQPVSEEALEYFYELQRFKGRSKIDLSVEIADEEGPYVTFSGSYVVQ
jgi:thioesterase domain-containing protein